MHKQWVIFILLFFIIFVFADYLPHSNDGDYDSIIDTALFPVQADSVITIAAVGDIMMGSTYPTPMLPADDGKELFDLVKAELTNCDITIGNLEAPFGDSGKLAKDSTEKHNFAFLTPISYVKNLKDAGFDVMNLANNHICDFGKAGFKTTRRVLDSAGIKYAGLVGDIAELKIKGKRIIAIGFSPHYCTYNLLNIPRAQRIVARMKKKSDIVIVSFHGGSEGIKSLHTRDTFEFQYDDPRGNVVQFAHAVIDSGADLVLGHGPHVPRAIEIYKDKLIAYSLGNFCTYGRFETAAEHGLSLILKVNLNDSGKFVTGKITPLYLEPPGIPLPDSAGRSISLIRDLSQYDFPLSAPEINNDGLILPNNQQFALMFWI
jgi:poly-gamma-glutamate capsule biosynthesis protein CapA/YwtB (metallophosphatase superfamily)